MTSAYLPSVNINYTFPNISSEDDVFTVTSDLITADFKFDSILLNRPDIKGEPLSVFAEINVGKGKKWSGWQSVALFAYGQNTSFSNPKNAVGKVETDIFRAYTYADKFQFRFTVTGRVKLNSVLISLTSRAAKFNITKALSLKKISEVNIPLAPISQMRQNTPERVRICSPASVLSVLKYYKVKTTLKEVMKRVYDHGAGIYGNWLFGSAAAAYYGLKGEAVRLNSYEELYNILSEDIPVIASISYEKGTLKGSPKPASAGHLLVIKGIDKNKNIITADPAAKTDKLAEIIYDKREFARAWLENKRGLAYLIYK
ncbi:Peptidase_C39 like family protein [Parelusimicrobium proximum]|uniref:C39 family peptidase n=1 Tax=Parelusimicrobium proximum TaxID=3228953 RepID=UPI003D175E93